MKIFLNDMKIAIIGATGFIGQNLLKALPEADSVSLRNEGWKLQVAISSVIINLVGKAHDHKGTATEQDYFYANVDLVKDVFNSFMDSSASLLIHISSLASIEEFEAVDPLKETDDCNPISLYGKSKRAAEKWLIEQELPSTKKLIILRPPMVHGSGDKGNLALLYKLLSKGIPYPLSSFDNNRSFISIDNFSFFIQKIIEKQGELESGIYHIADNESVSTKEIIKIIKNITDRRVPSIAIPKFLVKGIAKIGDIIPIPLNSSKLKKMTSDLLVSTRKIKQALGIDQLPLTAKEGLEKTIKSFEIRK